MLKTVIKNTAWLSLAEGVSRGLKLFLLIYVARALGPTGYGEFSFALAFISLLVILSDFGLSQITTRELSREQNKEKDFGTILSFKIILILIALVIMVVGALWATDNQSTQKVILILAGFALINSFTEIFFAFFRARQRMEFEAWTQMLQAIAVTGIGLLVVWMSPSVINLAWSYFAAGLIALGLIIAIFYTTVGKIQIRINLTAWTHLFKIAWPLGMVALSGMTYNYIDSIMLGRWGMIAETGWYNAAYKIILIAAIPSILIAKSFYPILSRAFHSSLEQLTRVWSRFLGAIIFIAIPVTIGGIVLANPIINTVYGAEFAPAILAFQILILSVSFMMLLTAFSHLFIVIDRQHTSFWITFTGALLNVILNFILIPRYSLYGAAIATLITMIVIVSAFVISAVKTGIKIIDSRSTIFIVKSLSATGLMYAVISQPTVSQWHLATITILGIITYFISHLMLARAIPLSPYHD